jgi:hypothetical protein
MSSPRRRRSTLAYPLVQGFRVLRAETLDSSNDKKKPKDEAGPAGAGAIQSPFKAQRYPKTVAARLTVCQQNPHLKTVANKSLKPPPQVPTVLERRGQRLALLWRDVILEGAAREHQRQQAQQQLLRARQQLRQRLHRVLET